MKGRFIVIEGIDGSGKSTQAERIAEYLNAPSERLVFGYRGVHLTKEPTSNLIGGLIRSQLNGDWQSSSECLQLLFAADRAYHLEKEILPLLKKDFIVVSDRYFLTALAFGALDLSARWLSEINKNFPIPDFTFYLDVSAKTAVQRIRRERHTLTLFEKERELKRVRANYRRFVAGMKNVYTVNGEQSVDAVTDAIINIINVKLR